MSVSYTFSCSGFYWKLHCIEVVCPAVITLYSKTLYTSLANLNKMDNIVETHHHKPRLT